MVNAFIPLPISDRVSYGSGSQTREAEFRSHLLTAPNSWDPDYSSLYFLDDHSDRQLLLVIFIEGEAGFKGKHLCKKLFSPSHCSGVTKGRGRGRSAAKLNEQLKSFQTFDFN